MTLSAVQLRISPIRPQLEFVHGIVKDKLAAFCEPRGIPYVGRIKDDASIAEKIETGRFSGWAEIDDLVAFAVVVPSLQSEPQVLDFLRSEFSEVVTRSRGSSAKSPDVFRFDATRYIGRLKPRPTGDEQGEAYAIQFEIQIRTAFEHAWSVATHASVYKPDRVDWKRLRLAAHLKAAVEQLDALVVAFDDMAPHLSSSTWPEIEAQVLVIAFVETLRAEGVVHEPSFPRSVGRFSENFIGLIKAAKRPRFNKLNEQVNDAIRIVRGHVDLGNTCPRSYSLYQWFTGLLAGAGFLSSISPDFSLPIDDDMVRDFVELSRVPGKFDWT